MMSSTLMILVSVTTMAVLSGEALAALPAQCNSGFLDELPPRLRKICIAIARIWDVRDMNDFVDDRGNRSCLIESVRFIAKLSPNCRRRWPPRRREARRTTL
ncbi:Myosuppressin [Temnothorax longispinosus]|uniref:Myosuppressin n=1 Tax=Temnothorax longispinosus TaxID=300112 RepID=A0A4V3SCH4_9HYME|nr:Myosuppressin [Temnothorax longispinosus]